MSDTASEIKSRLSIYDLVSQYVTLKKAGRNYKGLCPFHNEKTPSFVVSPEKDICHCFGCNKGGDIFGFLMELEGITFPEAVQVLADRAGVKIENTAKLYKGEKKGEKDEYFKAHELAATFFEKQLNDTGEGKKVLEYLKKRGVKDETIEKFRIGFAPDSYDKLTPYLLKKGIDKKILLKSGLAASKTTSAEEIYDKFRGRLMFPIFDYFGRICGFGGRSLKAEQMPKYLNSPENPIYEKGKLLYGLSHAKETIKEKDSLILVEGYFDVVLPSQEGIKNIAATSGTALTSNQVKLIKRLTANAVLCFDNDDAGFEAAKRAYSLMRQEDFSVKAVGNLDAKDPADYVLEKKNKFQEIVEKAPDFVSFYMDRLIKDNDVSNFEGRSKIIRDLLPVLKLLSPSARDFYIRELAAKIGIQESLLYDEVEQYSLPSDHPSKIVREESAKQVSKIVPEEVLMAILLEYPDSFKIINERISDEDFYGELKDIYIELVEQYNSARENFREWHLDEDFPPELRRKIDVLLLYAQEAYGEFSEDIVSAELDKLIDRMRKGRRMRRLEELRRQIEEAEKLADRDKLKTLMQEHIQLLES